MRVAVALAGLGLIASPGAVRSAEGRSVLAPSGVAAFSRHAGAYGARMSPNGTYVAAVRMEEGKRLLLFLDLRKGTSVVVEIDPRSEPSSLRWVSDERVVVELADRDGDLAAPVSRGEIYAVNATGRGGEIIFGYRGELSTGSRIPKAERDAAWGYVVAARRDGRHVVVGAREMRDVGDRQVHLYDLDAYSGVKTLIVHSPIREAGFLTDEDGEPRIAWGHDSEFRAKFFYREAGGGWRELASLQGVTRASQPAAFFAKGRLLYVIEEAEGRFDVVAVHVDSGERRLVASTETAPPALIRDQAGQVVAIESEPDLPVYSYLVPDHKICRLLRGLLAAYPGEHVRLVNWTRDGGRVLASIYSDRDPGRYLVVDSETMTADQVLSTRPWIRPEEMAETSAFHIAASDGFRIHGYFTLPARGEGGPPPLVVLPHGGPHLVRDDWRFNPEVQLLASEGFAVLQVNFRGSGGYGAAYQEAGYRKWGSRMTQDVVDATRFAIRKGFADPARICIYGASFGGYAAMQAAILAPDLFRCAVGYAGIYDLELLSRSDGFAISRQGRGFQRAVLGDDAEALKSASPVYNAARLTVPVLLVHGKKDRTAPIDHAERLREALEGQGRPPEWLVEADEAHGFYDEGARLRMYTRLLTFLKAHTGPAPAARTEPRPRPLAR